MSQRRFTSADFVSGNDGTIPDTVLDQADLDNLKEDTSGGLIVLGIDGDLEIRAEYG
jgi:hypothetical protein